MGAPVLVIEEVLKHIDRIEPDQRFYKLFVPPAVAYEGKAVAPTVGMQLILDHLMDRGFSYRDVRPMGAGHMYRYERWFEVSRTPSRQDGAG
jgi:hypothetical protein